MGLYSPPEAPDPKVTAAAQAGMNRDTAITQQYLNMTNQVGPDGSLTYDKTGEAEFVDSQGNVVKTPTFTATTKLSEAQQAIKTQTDAASLNLGTLANEQTAFLKSYLGKGLDTSGAPELRTEIGGGYSGNIGGSFRDTLGSDYSTTVGDGYTTDLGPDWKTTYAGADDFSADRQRVVDAIKARAAPDQAAASRALETQLIGRGLRPGTDAWKSEMERLGRSQNDFAIAADLAGGQEQSRLVGMSRDAAQFGNDATMQRATFGNASDLARMQAQNDAEMGKMGAENSAAGAAAAIRNEAALTGANFDNNARAHYLNELYASRNQPLNEISALLSGSQVSNPQFVNTPTTNVGGVDYTGLVSDKYKADTAAYQSKMGGLFGLLSAPFSMFKFSDRRLKRDIQRIGELDNGLGWYRFRYVWDAVSDPFRQGVMADEVRKTIPAAVVTDTRGFDMVDYSMLEAA